VCCGVKRLLSIGLIVLAAATPLAAALLRFEWVEARAAERAARVDEEREKLHAPSKLLDLDRARRNGDLLSQRRHVWSVLTQLAGTQASESEARFASWYGEDQVFDDASTMQVPRGIHGFSRGSVASTTPSSKGVEASHSADAPILTYTLYNAAAYEHIRAYGLYFRATLDLLQVAGPADEAVAANRAVPAFPAQSVVLKTGWWPVAQASVFTAVPVWDPRDNPPRRGGNGYLTWPRVVAIDPTNRSPPESTASVEFAGRTFPHAHRVNLQDFYSVIVDAELAANAMRDPDTQKAVSIALGRPLRVGDYLVLVAGNLATKEIGDWVWAAFWWHDRPDEGAFAASRPIELQGAWRNYLMQAAFDDAMPRTNQGEPHVCFNPWLEARFPDGGHGGGTSSNCLSCHRRASYPPIGFLPVTRGDPDLTGDPAYASGRLRTSFLWALALHAKP